MTKPLTAIEPIIDQATQIDVLLVNSNGQEQFIKTINYSKGNVEKNIDFSFNKSGKYRLKVVWKSGTRIKESYSNYFNVIALMQQQTQES